MPGAHMLAAEVGEALGRSRAWVLDHWRSLAAETAFPLPVMTSPPLAWSTVQVHAWLDRHLPEELRPAAAAYRAAYAAAAAAPLAGPSAAEAAEWTDRLDRMLDGLPASPP